MRCPECGREMQRLNRFWVCEAHDPPVSISIQTTQTRTKHAYSELCSQLPTPLAVPIDEFGRILDTISQGQAYRALWAMVDAAELITRSIAIVALLDVRQQTGETPEPLRKVLVNLLERPTFGAWREIAQVALRELGRSSFVEELPAFWQEHWEPLLNGDSAENSLLELRNMMAHTSRFRDEDAQRLLEAHRERFGNTIDQLKFWSRYRLVAILSKERRIRLQGTPDPQHWTLPEEQDPLPHQLLEREETVALAPDAQRFLELFPLQLYNPLLVYRDNSLVALDDRPALMVYMRYNRQRQLLEYTALAPDYAFSQQQLRDAFNELFPISKWRRELELQQVARTEWEQEGYHFRDLIDSLTEELYGRAAHLEQVKQWLRQHCESGGVLWIGGRPGVGKSALMAKLAKDLQGDSRAVLIPFFFRSGDHRCGADRFYRAACLRLAEQLRISLERKPNQRYADLFSEVMQRVSDALPNDKTVIFLLDGLDEGVRHEPELPEIPLRYQSPRVVWICAGRREESLRALRDTEATQKLWGDGELPPLTHDDIRAWLQNELERLRYELFELDRLDGDELRNKFIEELTLRSEGLPLYVRMVIEDLKTRQFTVWDGNLLPQGLEKYYQLLLERLSVGDVERVLTEVLALLSWAQEPLALQTIIAILMQAHLASQDELQQLVAQVLEFGHTTLERRITPEGEWGWTLYHDSFREFLRTSERVQVTRQEMQYALLAWCARWQTHKSPYALRHYAEHLREANEVAQLYALARDEAFAHAQGEVIPHDPDLPRQTAALALQAAIETEDAPMMAEMLLLHAQRVETVESPLDALHAGNPQRALKIAERILKEQDYQIGTLWLLLLAWAMLTQPIDDSERAETSLAVEALRVVNEWWQAHTPAALSGWQGSLAAFLLRELTQSIEAIALEIIPLLLQDEHKKQLVECLVGLEGEQGFEQANRNPEVAPTVVSKALAIAQAIADKWRRSTALAVIAERQAQAGQHAAAANTFAQALQTAQAIADEWWRSGVLTVIAERQAQAGLYPEALQTAQAIADEGRRSTALAVIAERQAQAELYPEVLQTAQAIADEWWRSEALAVIAERQAQAGLYPEALQTAQAIAYERRRSKALAVIAERQAQAGLYPEALQTAQAIADEGRRSTALAVIAERQAQAGQHAAAANTFAQALQTAQAIADEGRRSEALAVIAERQAQAGQHAAAANTFAQALQTAQAIADEGRRSEALAVIAERQAQAGQHAAAANTFAQALQTAQAIADEGRRSTALAVIAERQAQAELYPEVLQTAQAIAYERRRSKALAVIAERQAQAGLYPEALQTAQAIADEEQRSGVLTVIAERQAQAGLYPEALQTAQAIAYEGRRSTALAVIAVRQAQAGQHAAAANTFAQALQTAQAIAVEWWLSEALAVIAERQAQAGQHAAAANTFAQALQTAQAIADERWRSEALAVIAERQAQAGLYPEALQTAQAIADEGRRSKALAVIAVRQAQAGLYPEALQTAQAIADERWRSEALAVIAERQAQAGLYPEALQTAQAIAYEGRRSGVLTVIAERQAQAGLYPEALQTAQAIAYEGRRSGVLTVIAERQAQAGLYPEALQTAQAIAYEGRRSKALAVIAERQAQAGQHAAAANTFAQALQTAQAIADKWRRSEALAVIAERQAQAGLYPEALQTAQAIAYEGRRSKALAVIAERQAQAGLYPEALQTAQAIADKWRRSEALAVIAERQAQAGQHAAAANTFAQALQTAQAIADERWRSEALAVIAERQAQAGLYPEALQTAQAIAYEGRRSKALAVIAERQAQAGLYPEALQTAQAIEDEEQRSGVLTVIAERQAQAGMLDCAIETAKEIPNARKQNETRWAIAIIAVEIGKPAFAQQLASRMSIGREEKLLKLVDLLAERGEKATFLALLPRCGWSRVMAVNACLSLPRLYPQRNLAVLNVLVNELNIGGTEHSDGEVI
jgi:recombinational DNA repair protein (RecF pathway)